MAADDDPPLAPEDEDDTDDCLCGIEHIEGEETTDAELPPATGGVETRQGEVAG